MTEFFPDVTTINYQGHLSDDPLSFRYYDANKVIAGKTMQEHLRFAVCYWHTFCWQGADSFGRDNFSRGWSQANTSLQRAELKAQAAFEFFEKLTVPFFTFHDRDIAPEGDTLAETEKNLFHMGEVLAKQMEKSNTQLIWGTANLFTHPRYQAGAATNPDPAVFAYAVRQVKNALDLTQQLGGQSYVLWGGREGYDTLLNTDLKRESEQLARFLHLLVEYKHKIGFKGLLMLEPKPCEPTKHQYDFDSATVFAFLQKYGLEKEYKVNIEGNHATLAGHSFDHEVAYAFANDIFGSIDANVGDPQLGWDTDQFPIDLPTATRVMYQLLLHGGFQQGGFNFDAKVRRQSSDLNDLFYGHVNAMDTLAQGLLQAHNLLEKNEIEALRKQRYQQWDEDFGQQILNTLSFSEIADAAKNTADNITTHSGRQEYLELLLNRAN